MASEGNSEQSWCPDDPGLLIRFEDAPDIFERLRETKVDERGRAFLLNLDQLIVRLGTKWEVKQSFV